MKLDKAFFEDMIRAARSDQEKSKSNFDRQTGVIGLCELILKNAKFETEEAEIGTGKSS